MSQERPDQPAIAVRRTAIDKGTQPDHVRLAVPNLDRSVAFYQDVIGLRLLDRSDGEARLGTSATGLLRLVGRPGAPRPTPGSTGLFHFAILLPTRPDLARALQHLIAKGTPIQGFADHHVSEAIYLADPDGNGIELYRDRPQAGWLDEQGKVHMTTDPLDIDGLLQDAGETSFAALPDGTVLGHVHVKAAEIPAAEQFYCNVLGFELMLRYGQRASFVAAGGYHHHVGMNTWQSAAGPPPPPGALGMDWAAMSLPDAASLTVVVDRIQHAGLPTETVDGGILVADPSGNRLLLTTH